MKNIKQYITEFININNIKPEKTLKLVLRKGKKRYFIIVNSLEDFDELTKDYKDDSTENSLKKNRLKQIIKYGGTYLLSITAYNHLYDGSIYYNTKDDYIDKGEINFSDFNFEYFKKHNLLIR